MPLLWDAHNRICFNLNLGLSKTHLNKLKCVCVCVSTMPNILFSKQNYEDKMTNFSPGDKT